MLSLSVSALVPVISAGLTSFKGLDFLCLALVVTFLGVLIVNGTVINLYAGASRPFLCGTASGVATSS